MIQGLKGYLSSFSFLRKHDLLWVLWFPFGVTLLVFLGGFELTSWATESINVWLQSFISDQAWMGDWQGAIGTILYWVLWVILRILLYFAMAFLGGSVILILMSPVLAYISEKVAEKMGSDVPPFSLSRFLQDIGRGIMISAKNGLIQLGLTIVCFFLGLIPIIGLASPFLIIAINAYYFGFSLIDYSLERKGMNARMSASYNWNRKLTTTGLGLPFAIWMLVPFIGPITSGFVALLGTVAATIRVETDPSGLTKTAR